MDYKNGKIYKLQCEDGYFYVGSTATELRKRLSGHKKDSKKRPETKSYKHINEIGWDKVRIILIEEYPCENKQELNRREDYFITQFKDDNYCLNSYQAYLTEEENKERILNYQKQWYDNNKERLLEKAKKYQEEHKEQRNEWRMKNKEHLQQYEKNRPSRVQSKEKILTNE
jgi:predicted GIY-YIG superfamily endonuclease